MTSRRIDQLASVRRRVGRLAKQVGETYHKDVTPYLLDGWKHDLYNVQAALAQIETLLKLDDPLACEAVRSPMDLLDHEAVAHSGLIPADDV